jgi:hypothetical protein
MANYKIEGNIDFYASLYKSLDENSDDESDSQKKVCEITNSELTDRYVTLECNHTFNYDALYTEICKQKFEFNSYTTDVLSKTDLQSIRNSNLDYYIKCPYCRNVQFTLLPYYDDLPHVKKYGVNTSDTDYRVQPTHYIHSHSNNLQNYTFFVYGYKFAKGSCCKITEKNDKPIPCWNRYSTQIITADGITKSYCPLHVRGEAKLIKLEIKKKLIEEKMLAKVEAKQKILEAKAAAKQHALEAKTTTKTSTKTSTKTKKMTTLETTVDANANANICLPCSCIAVLKTGLRKGEPCGLKVFNDLSVSENNLCKRHLK